MLLPKKRPVLTEAKEEIAFAGASSAARQVAFGSTIRIRLLISKTGKPSKLDKIPSALWTGCFHPFPNQLTFLTSQSTLMAQSFLLHSMKSLSTSTFSYPGTPPMRLLFDPASSSRESSAFSDLFPAAPTKSSISASSTNGSSPVDTIHVSFGRPSKNHFNSGTSETIPNTFAHLL